VIGGRGSQRQASGRVDLGDRRAVRVCAGRARPARDADGCPAVLVIVSVDIEGADGVLDGDVTLAEGVASGLRIVEHDGALLGAITGALLDTLEDVGAVWRCVEGTARSAVPDVLDVAAIPSAWLDLALTVAVGGRRPS
jgi:hypothetical protein